MSATYALIHGAGDSGFHWHLLAPELRARGHAVVAPDLPCEDERAALDDYAEAVVEAIGERGDAGADGVVLVAQSFGGLTAPLVAARIPVALIVLVAGMVPLPGERGDEWFANSGYPGAAGESEAEIFYGDVPPEVVARVTVRERGQAEAVGRDPWPLERWPDVPTRVLLAREDRMFPFDWMRGVVRARLGIEPDEIDGGHCPALSRPAELAERLEALRLSAAAA